MKTYTLGDIPSRKVRERWGFKGLLHRSQGKEIRAVKTADFRSPKKGEWYLSGAIPTAYKAPNDLGIKFRIMELVLVERKTVETITILEKDYV